MEPDNKEQMLESNTARLFHAGIGGDARLDPKVKNRVWLRVAAELSRQAAPFPDHTLGALGALLVLAAAWGIGRYVGAAAPVTPDALQAVLLLFLALNLATMPVAAILIVIRRRSHA